MRSGWLLAIGFLTACSGGLITHGNLDPNEDAAVSGDDGPTTHVDLRARDLTDPVEAPPDLLAVDLTGVTPPDLTAPKTVGPFTLTFDLEAGAFPYKPGQPSALVYIPTGFDPTPPIDLVVYVHGHNNCVTNVVKETGGPCQTGGATRGASNLINQFEDAHKNALLVLPEVKFDVASGDPGKLGNADGFKNFLSELLPKLEPQIGAVGLPQIGDVIVMSHSGGYWAVAMMATKGGVTTHEVHLLDSLYGYASTFQDWIEQDPPAYEANPPQRRFFSVYTAGGGTDDNNIAMANSAKSWTWLDPSARVHDDTTSTWTLDQFVKGVMWKRSALSHSGVVLYYFQQLLETSPLLRDKP